MTSEFIENGSGQNLPPTPQEADLADILWIGAEKKLLQWSVSQEKVTKDYGDIMVSTILSMAQTSSKDYLFVSDLNGC
jgi:hypothetical protein